MDREESSNKVRQLKCKLGEDYLKSQVLGDEIYFYLAIPCVLVMTMFDFLNFVSAIRDGNVLRIVFSSLALAMIVASLGLVLLGFIKRRLRWRKSKKALTTDTLLLAYKLQEMQTKAELMARALLTQAIDTTKNDE